MLVDRVKSPKIELVGIDKFQGGTGVRTDAVEERQGTMNLVILPSLDEGPNGIGIRGGEERMLGLKS